MCSHGGCPKKQWQSQGLRGPQQAERVRQKRGLPTSSSRHNSRKIDRLQSLLKT